MVLSVALFDSSAGLARGLGTDEFGLVFYKNEDNKRIFVRLTLTLKCTIFSVRKGREVSKACKNRELESCSTMLFL